MSQGIELQLIMQITAPVAFLTFKMYGLRKRDGEQVEAHTHKNMEYGNKDTLDHLKKGI
jgi:hypothetical protein